jgi:DNA-binding response OmpR family regulator
MRNAKKRILGVEDDLDSCEMLAKFPGILGYEVISVNNAGDALRIVRIEKFDAYVLDNWLPDMTGIELCKQIRAFDRHTPIIFYSAAARQADHQEAMEAGAQSYISKPGNLDELEETIPLLLKRSNGKDNSDAEQ